MARYTLTRDQLDNIEYKLQDWAVDDPSVRVRPNYSGRGMYGATCVGIVHDSTTTVAAFLYFLAEEMGVGEDFLDLLSDLGGGSRDSMGLSTITYWRNLAVENEDDTERDNDDEEAIV